MWETKRVSSKNNIGTLTDLNHISKLSNEEILDIFDVIANIDDSQPVNKLRHAIIKWSDSNTLKDDNGDVLDIMIISKEDKIYWAPFVEYQILRDVITNTHSNRGKYSFKYENGNGTHLGILDTNKKEITTISTIPAYTMYIEIQ